MEMKQYQGQQPSSQSSYTTAEASRRIMDECARITKEVQRIVAPGGDMDQIMKAHNAFTTSDDPSLLREVMQMSQTLKSRLTQLQNELREVNRLPGEHRALFPISV